MNKDLCRMCLKQNYLVEGMFGADFDRIWKDGKCICRYYGNMLRKIADGPPENCPYIVEQAVTQC
jgi:hypothetical protein